jgi:hypothetical protein
LRDKNVNNFFIFSKPYFFIFLKAATLGMYNLCIGIWDLSCQEHKLVNTNVQASTFLSSEIFTVDILSCWHFITSTKWQVGYLRVGNLRFGSVT